MSEATKELNEILRKYNVSAEDVIEMMSQWVRKKSL